MSQDIERNAKVTISTEADALYIRIASNIAVGEAVRNESVTLKTGNLLVVFDFSADKKLLGIEILGANELLKD